ncbi:MAG TPA: hypothetical protein VIK86_08075 [Candidatus Paceibacterota bacterium]
MGFYDLYKKRTCSSLSDKEVLILETQERVLDGFESTTNYEKIINITKDIEQGVTIISTNLLDVKTILSKPNEIFNMGDIIDWENNKWIVVDIDMNDQIYTKGKIQLSNNSLNVYKNYIHLAIPCIIDQKMTYDKIDYNPIINTTQGTIMVTCQNNANTSTFTIDDRFIFNGQAFKINAINNFLLKNILGVNSCPLLYLTMSKDQISPDDDLVNNIANGLNYVAPIINSNKILPNIDSILETKQQAFSVYKYINSVANTNTFTITSSGVPNANYTLTIIDGNNFTITNNIRSTSKLHINCVNNTDATSVSIDVILKGAF